jgi:hypothetical protein
MKVNIYFRMQMCVKNLNIPNFFTHFSFSLCLPLDCRLGIREAKLEDFTRRFLFF